MRREHLFVAGVAVLLLGSLIWGYWQGQHAEAAVADAFRAWFWTRRSLDLAVQVVLIFVGALGVAAILPEQREEESDLCTWL